MRSAWRHFLRNKVHVMINLVGLTLALTVVAFIYLFVSDELSYDKWIPGYEQVVRLQPNTRINGEEKRWATSEGFVAPAIASAYPEVQSGTRTLLIDNELLINMGDKRIAQGGAIAVDSSFFEVFPMTFVYGGPTTTGIVITESVSKKLFGNNDPTGKTISTDVGEFLIGGVIQDLSRATHFHFNVAIPLKQWWPDSEQSRNMYAFYSYLRLSPGVDVKKFNEDIIRPWYSRFGYADNLKTSERRVTIDLEAMPIADIHLQSDREKEFEANGNAQVVTVFIGAGILLMIIAVINYINLSNAIAIRRSKEVAVRKTIGASKGQLFGSFMAESFFFTSIAIVASAGATGILLPYFNAFVGKQVGISVIGSAAFIGGTIIAWILISLCSGVYPATILSSYDPITILRSDKGAVKTSGLGGYLRYGLIGTQFTISAMMIVVASVIATQVNFINNRDIGFEKNDVIVLQLAGDSREKVHTLKSELQRINGVVSVSATSVVPGKRVFILMVRVPGISEEVKEMRVISADADILKTLQFKLIDGRDFTDDPADSLGAFILNEAAVKEFNWKDPVGQPFEYIFRGEKKGKVIGVVQDFNFASVHSKVDPVVLHIYPQMFLNLCVRIEPGTSSDVIQQIEGTWKSVTYTPFNWQFLDVSYDALYKTEQTTTKVVSWFMIISMFIAGLGLFGMITLFVQQRLKEVGIRKVMGASQLSLINRLSRDYLVVVIIGNLVAAYPSYLVVSAWLQQFAFRIDPGVLPFAMSLVLSLGLTMISIGWIVFKTARMNPVSVLRYE